MFLSIIHIKYYSVTTTVTPVLLHPPVSPSTVMIIFNKLSYGAISVSDLEKRKDVEQETYTAVSVSQGFRQLQLKCDLFFDCTHSSTCFNATVK